MALVLLAAMLWGTTGTAQSLAPATLSPYWVGALRLVIGSAFFAVLAWRAPARSGPWPWAQMALAGGCIAAYKTCLIVRGLQKALPKAKILR